MSKEKTGQNSDCADLRPGSKSFPILQGGPVISIKVVTGAIASLARMQSQIDIVRDISERLDAADIGYMLTGSMAMNGYALPCAPRNLDFVVALCPADAELMVRLFSPDYDISREQVDNAIAQRTFFNIFHRKNRMKVNCIVCQQIKYRFGLDLIVHTPKHLAERLKMGDWFLHDVLKEGKVLYESRGR